MGRPRANPDGSSHREEDYNKLKEMIPNYIVPDIWRMNLAHWELYERYTPLGAINRIRIILEHDFRELNDF